MPRISFECPSKLVGDPTPLRYRNSHVLPQHSTSIIVRIMYAYTVIMYTARNDCLFWRQDDGRHFSRALDKSGRNITPALWTRIQVKLDLLNACTSLEDLRVPPSNRLEKLRGD